MKNIEFNTAAFLSALMHFDPSLEKVTVLDIGICPAFRFYWGAHMTARNEYLFDGPDPIENENDLASFGDHFAGAYQTFLSMMESKEARDIEYCRSLAGELYSRFNWSQSNFPRWWSWDTSELREREAV